ncbi:DUF4157 domain-containing protein [Aquimarina hainanensis]|uniref:DUF4157 domain-containing protein n=1 Tax=Aquimarina hainanensis TaxID=1578017 RepID=A0ABW5NEL0_9FLAO
MRFLKQHKKNKKGSNTPFIGPKIQPKLTIGTPGDAYEVEADQMADTIVNKSSEPAVVQKKEMPVEEETVQAKYTDCEEEAAIQRKEEEQEIQAKSDQPSQGTPGLESRLNKGMGGQKLENKTRSEMEAGFGADFSQVQIHTDNKAAQMNQEIGAQAFTHGNDIYFNTGNYNPETKKGKHLLAHELTHTLQQKGMVQQKVQRHMQDTYPWSGIIANTWSASLRGQPRHTDFIMNIPRGTKVEVKSNVGNWLYVSFMFNGERKTGYVSQELVDFDQVANDANQRISDFDSFNSYPEVRGATGWTFGDETQGVIPEQELSMATANSLPELGAMSLLNYNVVNLGGQILEKIRTDPDMLATQQEILQAVRQDERYGETAFYITGRELVGFGGNRWTSSNESWSSTGDDNPLLHRETWQVAGNELTWALRNATVRYWAEVSPDGAVRITYHLNDRLDLSPSEGRSEAYNNISEVTGFLYHTLAGGNLNLQTRAEWTETFSNE